MYILAFKDGHDPAACIFKDGVLIAATEEERFNRIKHAPSIFPADSIRFCLSKAGISEQEVDHVVYARLKPFDAALKVFGYYAKRLPRTRTEWSYAFSHTKTQIRGVLMACVGKAGYQRLWLHFPHITRKLHSFDHHLCHAASAYFMSAFKDALVVTWDGKGEATSVMASKGDGVSLKTLERKGVFESLGLLYSAFTDYLGFTPNDGEYKVMGLAPYGSPDTDFTEILRADPEKGFVINSDFSLYPNVRSNIEKKFGVSRKREGKITQEHFSLGASLQSSLEAAGVSYIKMLIRRYGFDKPNLCLAGGVALNVKLNKALWDSGLVKDIFIQPAAGDDGLVMGAGALLYTKLTGRRVEPLKNLYLGPDFSRIEIESALNSSGIRFKRSANVISDTATLLEEGKVIGWFQDRMEFGPRALGDRSILADPRRKEMQEMVNAKIKFREAFRPFCPSILEGKGSDLFLNYFRSPFMITSFEVKNEGVAKLIPAVTHVDGTLRPQEVSRESNPLYYDLISEFEKRTGVPVLLNTSMNIRGEPMVCTPEDAINFFKSTHVDALVMGDFLCVRSEQDPKTLKPLTYDSLKTEY